MKIVRGTFNLNVYADAIIKDNGEIEILEEKGEHRDIKLVDYNEYEEITQEQYENMMGY